MWHSKSDRSKPSFDLEMFPMHLRSRAAILLASIPCVLGTSAYAGPDWVEQGDAGSSVGGAQVPLRPSGVTQLTNISGNLGQGLLPDYEDMYFIRVVDPGTWSIEPAVADFNIVLYIFNLTVNNEALGLLGNDN